MAVYHVRTMPTLGLDIGGANLKAATSDGRTAACAFPLWKHPERLAEQLRTLTTSFNDCQHVAVTMTGELADCFRTKAEGVSRILDAVAEFAGEKPVHVWTTAGKFVPLHEARSQWPIVAAANWQALATWAGRFVPKESALLIDLGSTTTDIIPLRDGVPCPVGRTDLERLLSGELVYTGTRRTPLCAVADVIELRGQPCRVAAELFATMLDVQLALKQVADDETDCDTADGRPATIEFAKDRIARMVCCDATELSAADVESLAQQFADAQQSQARQAIVRVLERQNSPLSACIVSGSGSNLAQRIAATVPALQDVARIDLASRLSPEIAESACAYAVAILWDEGVFQR